MADVIEDWGYYRPIAYGVVKLSLAEFDVLPPARVRKINAAMDRRSELERKEYEDLKSKARA